MAAIGRLESFGLTQVIGRYPTHKRQWHQLTAECFKPSALRLKPNQS